MCMLQDLQVFVPAQEFERDLEHALELEIFTVYRIKKKDVLL